MLRGRCSKAIAGHDMLTERMQRMIDEVLPGGFLPTICGTDLQVKTNFFAICRYDATTPSEMAVSGHE